MLSARTHPPRRMFAGLPQEAGQRKPGLRAEHWPDSKRHSGGIIVGSTACGGGLLVLCGSSQSQLLCNIHLHSQQRFAAVTGSLSALALPVSPPIVPYRSTNNIRRRLPRSCTRRQPLHARTLVPRPYPTMTPWTARPTTAI